MKSFRGLEACNLVTATIENNRFWTDVITFFNFCDGKWEVALSLCGTAAYCPSPRWYMCEYGATVGWYWQGKTEGFGEKRVPVPICPSQIPDGLPWERVHASAVRSRRLTAWATARPPTAVTPCELLLNVRKDKMAHWEKLPWSLVEYTCVTCEKFGPSCGKRMRSRPHRGNTERCVLKASNCVSRTDGPSSSWMLVRANWSTTNNMALSDDTTAPLAGEPLIRGIRTKLCVVSCLTQR
jgi:hypothetical protein